MNYRIVFPLKVGGAKRKRLRLRT